MLIGTVLELYLLKHYEGTLQLIPILCISVAMFLLILFLFFQTKILQNLFKIALSLCILSGFYGAYLHMEANLEFEKELAPTADNWHLFVESLSGALPVLAPLSMGVLALIGYAYILTINTNKL